MLDLEYIKELELLAQDDKKTAKEMLADYAAEFGIKVKKTKAFDVMVRDIEEELRKLNDEPMPEVDEGFTITDLISAADDASGKNVQFDEVELDEKATSAVYEILSDQPVLKNIEVIDVKDDSIPDLEENIQIDKNAESDLVENETPQDEPPVKTSLPVNFSPKLSLLGPEPGYCTLHWWVYEWIAKNDNWKEIIDEFPNPGHLEILQSLIYYIEKRGFVNIRETRNSRFYTLK